MYTQVNTAESKNTRRRSSRVILCIPVTVSGGTDEGAFTEDTHTLVVNAHGALILLGAELFVGQTIHVKNRAHAVEQDCCVRYCGPTVDGKTQFGVEFAQPAPDFWQVSFPPDDWTPDEEFFMAEAGAKLHR
jgi:hypothetical protein